MIFSGKVGGARTREQPIWGKHANEIPHPTCSRIGPVPLRMGPAEEGVILVNNSKGFYPNMGIFLNLEWAGRLRSKEMVNPGRSRRLLAPCPHPVHVPPQPSETSKKPDPRRPKRALGHRGCSKGFCMRRCTTACNPPDAPAFARPY